MTHIIKIGNSQGIRIPKPLVEQAHLEGKELKLELREEGILICPKKKARENWQSAIEQTIATGERVDIKLATPVPVYFTYITAWSTADGIHHFRDDIYRRDGVDELALGSN